MPEENVQAEQTSVGEAVSTEVKPEVEPKVEPQTQPLTEERLQQILTQEREKIRQSSRDIAKAEVEQANRRAKLAEAELSTIKSSFNNLDEDTRKEMELATLKGRDQQYQSLIQEDEQRKGSEAYRAKLQGSLTEHLEGLGIDPNDKRIDWAENEADFLAGRSKFDASVAKIIKENQSEAEKKMKDDFTQLEAKLRKDLGLDSVDTSASSGVPASDDEAFRKKMADPDYAATKEDLERIDKYFEKK